MKILVRIIKGLFYYSIGHIVAFFHYDFDYLHGPLFMGRMNGLLSIGWQVVVKDYFACRKIGVNIGVKWPVNPKTTVVGYKNINFDVDDLHIFQVPGCYYQGLGKISFGKGTYVAPNVGIITANHDFGNLERHMAPKDVIIGDGCWIGMNSIILPGVVLGAHTVVGAGSVVTKSFPEGSCIIAGNPAKVIRKI